MMARYATLERTAQCHPDLYGTDRPGELNTAQQPVTQPLRALSKPGLHPTHLDAQRTIALGLGRDAWSSLLVWGQGRLGCSGCICWVCAPLPVPYPYPPPRFLFLFWGHRTSSSHHGPKWLPGLNWRQSGGGGMLGQVTQGTSTEGSRVCTSGGVLSYSSS